MLRLTVSEGMETGKTFVLSETSIGLGSAPDNEVQLGDAFVSRHHGRLSRVGNRWLYQDLGSTNGSTIERAGRRISLDREHPEAELEPGDLLLLGETRLRFEIAEAAETLPEHTVVASRSLEELAASRQRQLANLDDLVAAYRWERQLGLALGPEEMLDAVLEAVLEAFPAATHVILLLVDKQSGRPKRQVARVRGEEGRAEEEIPVSMSVATRVLQEGRSLLFLDVPAEFADSQSVARARISSSLCAPLWTGEESVGLIQVESRGGKASFSEGDLDRLSLLANRAALAIVASELCEAEQRNRLVRDLSAMITHDLKGPLTAIMGFLDLLAQEDLESHLREYVEIALASSRWLSILIAGILDVARMEAGGIELHRELLEVGEEIGQALTPISYQFQEKGVRLETTVPADLPRVPADREVFRRVVVNLVGNAVKFAPQGSKISVSAARDDVGNFIVVSVQDEGPGIAREHQTRIFEKFVQVAKGRSAERISVGLGLAFCKLAVEAHGGSIWVESEPGHGSRFSFSLPLGTAIYRPE